MFDHTTVSLRGDLDIPVPEPDTGPAPMPEVSFAEDFFTIAATPNLSPPVRRFLVEEAAAGPLRRRADYFAGPVADLDWFQAALAIDGLTEADLRPLVISLTNGSGGTATLCPLTARVLTHPACTDDVALLLLTSASCRKEVDGTSPLTGCVLAELDKVAHPAAAAWRIATALWGEPTSGAQTLVPKLRAIGPDATAAADRLAATWSGTAVQLLEASLAVTTAAGRG